MTSKKPQKFSLMQLIQSSLKIGNDLSYLQKKTQYANSGCSLNIFHLFNFYLYFILVIQFCFLSHTRDLWKSSDQGYSCRPGYRCRPVATGTTMWDPSRVCDLHHSSWQHRIPDPLIEGREPTSSWTLVRLISAAPQWELPQLFFKLKKSYYFYNKERET